jgi:putative Holliday junction resolvase
LIALDIGDRWLGVAACDATRRWVTVLPVLRRSATGQEIAALATLIAERGVTGLVIGLPLLPGGTEGTQAARTRAYADRLQQALGLPVVFVDERHSSVLVERGPLGRSRRRQRLDSEAAAVILEDFLASQPTR